MVTGKVKQSPIKSIKVEFSDEPVTAWGGLALVEGLASTMGLWGVLGKALPEREGCVHDWLSTIKAMVAGLLSGAQGTYAAESVRNDEVLKSMLGLKEVTEEANLWRMLGGMGQGKVEEVLDQTHKVWGRRMLGRLPRPMLLHEGFMPLFNDGSLLEGSRRREGSKWIEDKGHGMMWATVFAGSMLVGQRLCGPGEGENSALMKLLPGVIEQVLKPLKLHRHALALLDSLHGDGPTLDQLEKELKIHYIVGANKLALTDTLLQEQPEAVWQDTGARQERGWTESGACVCWIQCPEWERKRVLVGRRWKVAGNFLYHYSGVMTDLTRTDLGGMMNRRSLSFAQAVWSLYDRKAAMEIHYKELLDDLGLHHPPCQQLKRNRGFYAVASLAYLLGRAVDLMGGRDGERGSERRRDGGLRRRARPRSMRLWRLRRTLLALPARVSVHARQACVRILGASPTLQRQFEQYWLGVSRC